MLTESSYLENGNHRSQLEVRHWEVGLEIRSSDDSRHDSVKAVKLRLPQRESIMWRRLTLDHIRTVKDMW